MNTPSIDIPGIVLGSGAAEVCIRFLLLVLLSLWAMRQLVKTRIGSLDAVAVVSYPRLVAGLLVCNLVYLASFQGLLLLRPADSWWQFFKYLGAHIVAYPVVGMAVSAIGYAIDGGRAIRVLSDRFKPGPQPNLVDLTKEKGRVAQLIPRGAITAHLLLTMLSLVTAAYLLRVPRK